MDQLSPLLPLLLLTCTYIVIISKNSFTSNIPFMFGYNGKQDKKLLELIFFVEIKNLEYCKPRQTEGA